MPRLVLLLVCAALAGCARHGPAAALTRCYTVQTPVEIDGTPQRALSTWCIEQDGKTALRS
jgi:hypothetical protein